MKTFTISLLFASFLITYGEKARFDNYLVYSVKITNESQLKLLQELESHQNGILFMKMPIAVGQTVEIIVPPHEFAKISELFDEYEIKSWLKIKNLQK